MWRSVASNALTLFIVLLVVAAGLLAWGREEFNGAGPLAAPICFEVESGATLAEVSRTLETQGAVSDARIFRIGTDYAGRAQDLKAGSYILNPQASMAAIVDVVTKGGPSNCGTEIVFRVGVSAAEVLVRKLDPATQDMVEVVSFVPGAPAVPPEYTAAIDGGARLNVQIIEGSTVAMTVAALNAADFLTGEIKDIPAEGLLAPDTYGVEPGADRAALIARMTAEQTEALAEVWATRAEGLPYDTPEAALVMASIIEKETSVPEERGRVASVFVNRLRQGMRLQTDPTVIYGITKGESVLGRGLRQSELRRETPWNTYVIDGLPPSPIAIPSRASIEAAVRPDTTPYLFFVADGTGGHAFAETLEAHNENVAKWRAIEAARGEEGATGVQGE